LHKGRASLGQIYEYIRENFRYYRETSESGWKNSIRHNLTHHPCFTKVDRRDDEPGKGGLWMIDQEHASMFQHGIFRRKQRKFKSTGFSQPVTAQPLSAYKSPSESPASSIRFDVSIGSFGGSLEGLTWSTILGESQDAQNVSQPPTTGRVQMLDLDSSANLMDSMQSFPSSLGQSALLSQRLVAAAAAGHECDDRAVRLYDPNHSLTMADITASLNDVAKECPTKGDDQLMVVGKRIRGHDSGSEGIPECRDIFVSPAPPPDRSSTAAEMVQALGRCEGGDVGLDFRSDAMELMNTLESVPLTASLSAVM